MTNRGPKTYKQIIKLIDKAGTIDDLKMIKAEMERSMDIGKIKEDQASTIEYFLCQKIKIIEDFLKSNPRRKAKRTRRNPRYARRGTLEGHNATINIRIPKNKDTKEFLTAFLNSWAEKLNRRIYFHLFEMDYGYSIDFTFSPRFESGSSLQNAKRFATEASRQLQQTFGNVVEAFVSEWREG